MTNWDEQALILDLVKLDREGIKVADMIEEGLAKFEAAAEKKLGKNFDPLSQEFFKFLAEYEEEDF